MEKKIYDIVFAAQYEGLSTKEATDQLLVLRRSEQLKAFAHFLKWQPEGYIAYSTEEEMIKDFKSL